MAEPINKIKRIEITEEEKRRLELEDLENTLLENKDAVKQWLEVMGHMEERGILELLNGLFGQGDKVLNTLVKAIDKPESVNSLKNLMLLGGTLGLIDVKQLEPLLVRLDTGIARVADQFEEKEQKAGVFQIIRALRDPDVNRSVMMMITFLKGMGENTEEIREEMQPKSQQKQEFHSKTRN